LLRAFADDVPMRPTGITGYNAADRHPGRCPVRFAVTLLIVL
jgi:hypothetical protein